jgi:hypothetical protein
MSASGMAGRPKAEGGRPVSGARSAPGDGALASRGAPIDPIVRSFLVITATSSTAVFTVMFQIGAWGVVFFDKLQVIWVLATATLLSSLVLRDRWSPSVWGRGVLLVPSLWLATGYIDSAWSAVDLGPLTTATSVITLLSIPYLALALLRALSPAFLDLPARRLQAGAILIALAVGLCGLLMGSTNDRYLTCGDFVVSGNDQPADCRPGAPTTTLPRYR